MRRVRVIVKQKQKHQYKGRKIVVIIASLHQGPRKSRTVRTILELQDCPRWLAKQVTVNNRHLLAQRQIINRKKQPCLQFTKRRSLLLSQINRNQCKYKIAKTKKKKERRRRRRRKRKRIQSREKGKKKHRKQSKERSKMRK